jgi:opine dehydrogenase
VRFAVLGAGPGGQTWTTALTLAGHEVALWFPGWSDTGHRKLAAVRECGIDAVGAIEAHVTPERATADLAEAVDGADVIVIVTPARAHRGFATWLAPLVDPKQVIVLGPGRTGGAFEVHATLVAAGVHCAAVAETDSMPFTARLRGPNLVGVADRKREVGLGTLPAHAAPAVVAMMADAIPVAPRRSVLETSFENIGSVFHVTPMLLNAGGIERAGLEVYYRDAVSPSVARVMEKVDEERVRTAAAYGVDVRSSVDLLAERYGNREPGLYAAIQGNEAYVDIGGVEGLQHRYLIDDLPVSVGPTVALAQAAGVPVPAHEALLSLGSALMGEDYRETGRNLRTMGLDGLDAAGIRAAAER